MHEPEAYAELNPFTAIWSIERETDEPLHEKISCRLKNAAAYFCA